MASTDSPLAHAETCRKYWDMEDEAPWPRTPESPARARPDSADTYRDDQTFSLSTMREADRSDDDQTVAPPRTPLDTVEGPTPDDASDVSDLSN